MTAAAIHILTSRFILDVPDAAMRPPWVAISPSRISRRPIRASKVTDIHPMTSQSSLRLPLSAGIGKTSLAMWAPTLVR